MLTEIQEIRSVEHVYFAPLPKFSEKLLSHAKLHCNQAAKLWSKSSFDMVAVRHLEF